MKKILLLILMLNRLWSASTEEIVEYLSFSQSDQQLISIEQVFDSMRQTQESNESNASTTQVSIVYQEYLEDHLSSREITEILALYRVPAMDRYVNEVKTAVIDQEDMSAFLESLNEEPLLSEREDIVTELVDALVNEELQLSFYRSMMQRYPQRKDDNNSIENNNSSPSATMTDKNTEVKKKPSKREESFVNSMQESAKNRIMYGTQVFSLEEMSELKEAMTSSIFQKIKRVENEALVQIMNDYIQGVVSKPKRAKEKKIK